MLGISGQPELYDCPNGLAFAGRNRGVADSCDYPWRGNYCEGKQLASKKTALDNGKKSLHVLTSLIFCMF